MIIRTISLLPRVTNNITNDSLFEVSVHKDIAGTSNGKYISKSITYLDLEGQIRDATSELLEYTYGLKNGAQPLNLKNINTQVLSMASGTFQFSGKKTFNNGIFLNSVPAYNKNLTKSDANYKHIVTAGYVKDVIDNLPNMFTLKSKYANVYFIFNDPTNPHIAYIQGNGSKDNKTLYSGWLTVYGWLADNSTTDTASAWVSLEGQFEDGTWQKLQIQPWIIGEKHSNLQYMTFGIPVSTGVKLRILTGFDLNYNNSAYQGRTNSLVQNISGAGQNMTNGFIGNIYY